MWAIMRATSIAVVGEDRVPRDLAERDVLRGQPRGRAHQHRALDLVRMVQRPLQDLHPAERPADRRVHPRDAQRPQQRAVHLGQVAHGEQREVQPVRLARRRVDRRRPGRPLAPAQQVRADHVEARPCRPRDPARSACPTRPRPRRRRSARGRCRRPAATGRRSARTRSPAAPARRRTRASDRPRGRGSQPRVRREEITPVSKPARCRPPWKRACSIFTQRLETTSSPADDAISAASSLCSPSCIQNAPAPASTASRATAGQLVRAAEDVDDVGRPGQLRQRRVALHAEDLRLVRRDRPDLVVGRRRQQVGQHEVRRPRRVGGRADDGDRLRAPQDREPLAGGGWRPAHPSARSRS